MNKHGITNIKLYIKRINGLDKYFKICFLNTKNIAANIIITLTPINNDVNNFGSVTGCCIIK